MERASFGVGQHAMRAAVGSAVLLNVVYSAFQGWSGKGAPGHAGGLRFGGRPGTADSLPVLSLIARRRTHFAPFGPLRSNRRRQVSPRSALRARATSLPLLSASEAPSDLPERAFAETYLVSGRRANTVALPERGLAFRGKPQAVAARQAVPGRGDFWGGEERSPEVGARSALQHLTRGRLFERSERSERSEFDRATSGRAPQRSRRTRRPPRHEPLPGTACRAALNLRKSGIASDRKKNT